MVASSAQLVIYLFKQDKTFRFKQDKTHQKRRLAFAKIRVANNVGAILVILANIGQDSQYRANIGYNIAPILVYNIAPILTNNIASILANNIGKQYWRNIGLYWLYNIGQY